MWFREVIRSKTGCVVMVVVSDLEREIVESCSSSCRVYYIYFRANTLHSFLPQLWDIYEERLSSSVLVGTNSRNKSQSIQSGHGV